MPYESPQRTIAIVSACMTVDGLPRFVLNEVAVGLDEAENGVQYSLAEARLLSDGYEEPFVHFGADEAPAFFHDAVRRHLGVATHDELSLRQR